MDNLPKIKFCGMSQKDDIDAAIKLKVNWIGIIYVYSSHRYVDFTTSDLIIDQYKDLIDFVGVFVNADDNLLKRAVKSGINAIQLHGDETPERCMEVKSNFNLPIIKAFPISEQEDLDKIRNYEDCCEMFLFDAKSTNMDKTLGGNGRVFDWNIIKNNESWLRNFKPWILSGGLNQKNIIEALKLTKAEAIDISSGIENDLGEKDINLMQEFIFKLGKLKNINEF